MIINQTTTYSRLTLCKHRVNDGCEYYIATKDVSFWLQVVSYDSVNITILSAARAAE